MVGRLPGDLPLRWPHRCHPGQPAAGLPRVRLLLRGGALPLRRLRHRGVRDVLRVLLLVAQDDRSDARRAPRQAALLAPLRRLPHHVPRPALAGCRGHATSLRRLPPGRRLHHAQPDLHGGLVPAGRLDAALPAQRLRLAARRRRSWSTTRGAGAARSSGPPAARRRATTSTRCRGSAPSRRPSTCTTRRSRDRAGRQPRRWRTATLADAPEVARPRGDAARPRHRRDRGDENR